MITLVSELCALVKSGKLRDRGLCNKLVTGVVRNIAAGVIRMLLQNTARYYGARVNTNFLSSQATCGLRCTNWHKTPKLSTQFHEKSVDLYPNLKINVQNTGIN